MTKLIFPVITSKMATRYPERETEGDTKPNLRKKIKIFSRKLSIVFLIKSGIYMYIFSCFRLPYLALLYRAVKKWTKEKIGSVKKKSIHSVGVIQSVKNLKIKYSMINNINMLKNINATLLNIFFMFFLSRKKVNFSE